MVGTGRGRGCLQRPGEREPFPPGPGTGTSGSRPAPGPASPWGECGPFPPKTLGSNRADDAVQPLANLVAWAPLRRTLGEAALVLC